MPNRKPAHDSRLIDRLIGHVVDRATHTAVIDVTTKGPLLIEGAPMDVMARLKESGMAAAFNAEYGERIDEWNYIILVDVPTVARS